jgi:hypothetical protein
VVALKMILSGAEAGAAEVARFRVEAQAVAGLQHPSIVQIFELGEHDGLPFMVMEYCEGGSLAKRLGEQPMKARDAARLVRLLARAVAHAHAHGVVHRDLKPDNVLLAPAADEPGLNCELGCPKVSDFGLARRQGAGPRLTSKRAMVGTPDYMAPEQVEGAGEIGPPADVHALGAILYRLLTGHTPFESPSLSEILYKVAHQEPQPPRRLRPEVPEGLEALCLRCLRKDPAARFTAAQLAESLGRFLAGEPPADKDGVGGVAPDQEETEVARITPGPLPPPVPSPARPPRRRLLLLGLAVGACLGLAVLASWLAPLLRGKPEGPNGPKDGGAALVGELAVRSLRVMRHPHREEDQDDRAQQGEIGKDTFTTRFDDGVRVEAELSVPCHAFLIAFTPDGKHVLLWPADETGAPDARRAPPRAEVVSYHPTRPGRGFKLDENPRGGTQAFVVVASREPLPPFQEWSKGWKERPWRALPPRRAVWLSDGEWTETRSAGVPAVRSLDAPLPDEPVLRPLCRGLRRAGADVVLGVAFGVQPKEGGQ